MRIVVVAGEVSGAKFLQGVLSLTDGQRHTVTAVVNTGGDITLHGLRICPDLDTVMYTLGNAVDPQQGWGRQDDTWVIKKELAAYGIEPVWFTLGDRDLATHLIRTRLLDIGFPLSFVTDTLCARWQLKARLLPMTDDHVETHVLVADPDTGRRTIHLQEWWVRYGAKLRAEAFVATNIEQARPAPGVLEEIGRADLILLAPSNPVISIGTIIAVPGVREAIRGAPGPVVGISPVVGVSPEGRTAPVRGIVEQSLATIDVKCTAGAIGRHYGSRRNGGLLDGWLVDPRDAGVVVPGVEVRPVPLHTTDMRANTAMVRVALGLAEEVWHL